MAKSTGTECGPQPLLAVAAQVRAHEFPVIAGKDVPIGKCRMGPSHAATAAGHVFLSGIDALSAFMLGPIETVTMSGISPYDSDRAISRAALSVIP